MRGSVLARGDVVGEPETDFLRANAYHEAGHAIVGWALGGRVLEIKIRDDRPGQRTDIAGTDSLPLVEQLAVCVAGQVSEEVFGQLLPSWASGGDRGMVINLLLANKVPAAEIPNCPALIAGRARARELLRQHEREVHRLAARLIECRRMDAGGFQRFMEGAER